MSNETRLADLTMRMVAVEREVAELKAAARRSQPAPEAVPVCPPWCGSGEVPPLGARVYVREAPRGTADPHGWYASEECRTSSRCLHLADRAKAKAGERDHGY